MTRKRKKSLPADRESRIEQLLRNIEEAHNVMLQKIESWPDGPAKVNVLEKILEQKAKLLQMARRSMQLQLRAQGLEGSDEEVDLVAKYANLLRVCAKSRATP